MIWEDDVTGKLIRMRKIAVVAYLKIDLLYQHLHVLR
jgi:hypothetical protein